MEELKRFDIAEWNGIAMVVVESDILPPDPALVVIPLLPDYPAAKGLNPTIPHKGQPLVLATRLVTSVRRSALSRKASAAGHADEITRALDILLTGV
ncbi:CcdB family protein [Vannielia litorea]|uniref:Toxin CcdB n=1 Tax=Vannielia litorea TaxID=1217970 RepID=A0A1N6FGX0_9RHOB|nr:CcdB family protein [Vannielia litorea]SIN94509.1 toxin CcdB [Vannielia litorea]